MEAAKLTSAEPQVSLRHCRDFRLILYGQTVSELGSRVASIAVPLLVLATGHSAAAAGVALFVARLPVIFYLPAGVLADRWNRKLTMLYCDIARLLAFASLTLSAALGRVTLPHLLVVAFLSGALAVLFEVSEKSALPSYVPPELLKDALARNQVRTLGADVAGPPLGGVLFAAGQALPFLTNAISFGVSSIALMFVRAEPSEDVRRPRLRHAWRGELTEGLRWLWRDSFLRTASVVVAFVNLVFSALILMLIISAEERGWSSAQTGVIIGFFGGGGILGGVLAGKVLDRVPRRLMMVGAIWFWAAAIPVLFLMPVALLTGVVAALIALIAPIWNVAAQLYQYARIPPEMYGRVSSGGMMISSVAAPIGLLGVGLLAGSFGSVTAIASCTGIMLASALAATLSKGFKAIRE